MNEQVSELTTPIIESPALDYRAAVTAAESMMLEDKQVEIPVRHYFSKGVYAREITIPKGTYLTGAIHKYPQINIMSKGRLSVATEDGPVTIEAPYTVCSPAGVKRIAYAHEETVWTTIIATDETDPEKIEQMFTVKTFAEYDGFVLSNIADKIEEK